MSDSVTTSVEVAVAPEVAFDVFTREIDAWYRVDQETLPDLTRTAAIRFEPYLGGRLLDVHDSASGEGRELGRITCWERGRRLTFVDNEGTEIDVSFDPSGAGTQVTLTHRGLDRVSATRAAQLRRKGWAALVPFYRDHIAPNARPAGLAVAFLAILIATISVGALITYRLADGKPAVAWIGFGIVLIAIVLLGKVELRVASRLVRSRWQYSRIWTVVLVVCMAGFLIYRIGYVIAHGEDPFEALVELMGLGLLWLFVRLELSRGPAAQRNARKRKASATSPRPLNNPSSVPGRPTTRAIIKVLPPRIRAFHSSHRWFQIFLELTPYALIVGFVYLTPSLGASFVRAFLVLLLLSATLGLTHACVHRIKAKNARERKASATSPRLLNNPSSLVHPRIRAFVSSHRSLQIFLEFTVVALPTGFSYLIPSLGASFLRASVVLLLLSLTLLLTLAYVHEIKAKKSLGFDPDYFLSVERRVSEQGCRPEVLIHKPSGHPEFSGWWAYAGDHADGKKDFVKWSVEDLVNHTPEAAVPLRHGHGRWKWNDAQKAYQAI